MQWQQVFLLKLKTYLKKIRIYLLNLWKPQSK